MCANIKRKARRLRQRINQRTPIINALWEGKLPAKEKKE